MPHIDQEGRIRIRIKNNPRVNKNGYIYEHDLIAFQILGGRLPPKVVVHHIDNNKTNNHHSNLVICQDNGYHLLIHRRERAFMATGNPNLRYCYQCHEWKKSYDFTRRALCRICNKILQRKWRNDHPDYYNRMYSKIKRHERYIREKERSLNVS